LINLNNFSNVNHPNIVRFIGTCTSNSREQYIVTEFVSKGSLLDVLRNEKEKIDMNDLLEM
jgi:serine/threonine protein kinase